ncbi:hypothetical protein VKT23_015371 [Stygiomarasmius scandens]|uniref:Transmembrane protein n=1 Tax=Marasmiellus scandens TaxID=2682957 RepID=A0ABR1IY96_9AGAR
MFYFTVTVADKDIDQNGGHHTSFPNNSSQQPPGHESSPHRFSRHTSTSAKTSTRRVSRQSAAPNNGSVKPSKGSDAASGHSGPRRLPTGEYAGTVPRASRQMSTSTQTPTQRISRQSTAPNNGSVKPSKGSDAASGRSGRRSIPIFIRVVVAWVVAAALAVGHHFFNQSELNGRPVNSISIGGHRLPQSGVGHIENLFAVVIMLLLSYSLTASYARIIWNYVGSSGHTPETVNWLFDLLHSRNELWHVNHWGEHKRAVFFAVISLGLAAPSTLVPGSLTVQPQLANNVTDCVVRTVNLSQLASPLPGSSSGVQIETFQRAALYALISGTNQLAYYSCGSNCSYSITFQAPALVCNAASPGPPNLSIWNATQSTSTLGNQSVLHIEWYPLSTPFPPSGQPNALDCVATDASYTAAVSQIQPAPLMDNGTLSSQLELLNVNLTVIPGVASAMMSPDIISNLLINVTFGMLQGVVSFADNGSTAFLSSQTQVLLWSAATLSTTSQFISFENEVDLENAVTKLMQDTVLNIASLSPALNTVPCTKTLQTIVYSYNWQLLGWPYIGAFSMVLCAIIFSLTTRQNRQLEDQKCNTILEHLQLEEHSNREQKIQIKRRYRSVA